LSKQAKIGLSTGNRSPYYNDQFKRFK